MPPIKIEVTVDVTTWQQHRVEALREFIARSESGPEPVLEVEDDEEDPDSTVEIWTMELIVQLVFRVLAKNGNAQAMVIKEAMVTGVVDRSRVYELAGWDQEKRSLRGFTRPIDNAVAEMVAAGLLRNDIEIPQVLRPHYEGPGKAKWFTVPRELVLLQRRSEDSAA